MKEEKEEAIQTVREKNLHLGEVEGKLEVIEREILPEKDANLVKKEQYIVGLEG